MRTYFPWRGGNRFKLLIDGAEFVPALLNAVQGARHHVYLEMYLVESGEFADRLIEALRAAAQRGVRIYLLFDAFGAKGLRDNDRARLRIERIAMTFYNPFVLREWRGYLLRDHRKLLIVDDDVAYLGGVGITDDFWPGRRVPPWRDTMIEVHGACVADWVAVFHRVWPLWSNRDLPPPTRPSFAQTEEWGRATCVGGGFGQEVKRSFVNRLRNAERRVWVATAYFVPSRKIVRALKNAARGGVDVRLLLPGTVTDHPAIRHAGRRYYLRLLRAGVRIFEYQPTFNHSKVALCDEWISIGSSNIDRWNLRWNLEGNQESTSPGLVGAVIDMFEADFCKALEIELESWHRRPWWWRWGERFWGAIDIWLEKFSDRWRAHQRGRPRKRM